MKLNESIKCPYCGKNNSYAHQRKYVSLWDDSLYEEMKNRFEKASIILQNHADTAIYRCKCNDCDKDFSALVVLKIEVVGSISAEKTGELIDIKMSDFENRMNKEGGEKI